MSEERLRRIAELKLRRYGKVPIEERIRIFSSAIADNDLELLRGCFEVGGLPCDLYYFDNSRYPAKDIIDGTLRPVKTKVWEIFLEFGI